ncbi:hypothetical protein SEA_ROBINSPARKLES_116 [Gordonia phage RobinSparkles]|nr:hypothetical protein SEA_ROBINSPARKLES_116 [Gordonia phage RobinSparkles]
MSNLKLPTMSASALRELVEDGTSETIAYKTDVEVFSDRVNVKHHGNLIAVLRDDYIFISNCGYETSTTANRLNAIVSAYCPRYRVGITQGSMVIRDTENDWAESPVYPGGIFINRNGTITR